MGALLALAVTLGLSPAATATSRPAVRIGVSLAVAGADGRWGVPMLRGVELAVEDVAGAGGAAGLPLETLVLDSGGPDAGGVLRGLVVSNYERFVADPTVMAVVGPQTSSEGRAVAPLLRQASLATVTPSGTAFDITAPEYKSHFRPDGRVVYFRAVGTELAQAEAMARFAHGRLGVRRLALIDDGSDFGARMVATVAREARELGIAVARTQISWNASDYRAELRGLAAQGPEAVYFAGGYLVGVRVARQVREVLPAVHRLGADSLYDGAFPRQAGAAAAEGWYVSNVAPDVHAGPSAAAWAERFRRRFGEPPTSYSLTAYTAATVIADAVRRVATRSQPVTRATVRDAIQHTQLADAVQGPVSFDANGDLHQAPVSIYQVRRGAFRHVETVTVMGAPRAPEGRP